MDDPESAGRGFERLTRTELVERLRHAEREIASLRQVVRRLSERVAELERTAGKSPVLDSPHRPGTSSVEKITRQALRHMHDPAFLQRCALAQWLAATQGQVPAARDLQHALYQAIDILKPEAAEAQAGISGLQYQILVQTFVEKRKSTDVADTLAISDRQYYRLLKQAAWRVADYLLSSSCSLLASPSGGDDR